MLQEKFLPKIAGFTELIELMEAHHEEMNEVIRKFDESMCTKAGKSWVTETVEDLKVKYVSREDLSDIDSRF